ncbi:hypothetical protein ES702_02836 [subsurface metagenome]
MKTESEIRSLGKRRADTCYYKEYNKGDCMVSGTIRLHFYCKYCIKVRRLKKDYKKGERMGLETLFKEAFKCFNSKEGNCNISYSDPNLFDKCFYCLEKIQGINPPKNMKGSNPLKSVKSKKKGSETILKKSPGKELEIPDQTIKKFKCPYLLASYPFFKDDSKFYNLSVKHLKGEEELVNYAYSMEGEYKISSYRNPKSMDIKVSLVNIYLSDYFKSRIYEVSVKEFLGHMKLKSTGYYRNEILKSQHFLKNTTFITPIINYKTGKKFGIHEWSILSEFKFHDEKRGKYFYEIHLGDTVYKEIHNNKYTLLELEKVLDLSRIALNLFLYLKTQNPFNLYKYPKDWELLKIAIGITTKHITESRKTFEKAWSDIKSKGLLKGYRKSEVYIFKKDNKKKIRFSFSRQRILKS